MLVPPTKGGKRKTGGNTRVPRGKDQPMKFGSNPKFVWDGTVEFSRPFSPRSVVVRQIGVHRTNCCSVTSLAFSIFLVRLSSEKCSSWRFWSLVNVNIRESIYEALSNNTSNRILILLEFSRWDYIPRQVFARVYRVNRNRASYNACAEYPVDSFSR